MPSPRLAAAVAGGAAALAVVPPASADSITPNACKWSLDDLYRTLDVELSGVPNPAEVTAGVPVTLEQASVRAVLPAEVAVFGYNVNLLDKGRNELPAKVLLALGAANTVESAKTVALETLATTTVTDNGGGDVSATPIDVRIPIPPQSWTPTGAGRVDFAEGPPGLLGGALAGSAHISVTLPRGGRMTLDCSPGVAARDGKSFTPGTGLPFASAPVAGIRRAAAPAALTQSPTRVPRLRGRTLRTGFVLTCPMTTSGCGGSVRLRHEGALIGKLGWSVAPGQARELAVRLTRRGHRLVTKERNLSLQLTGTCRCTPGRTASSTTRTVRLRVPR